MPRLIFPRVAAVRCVKKMRGGAQSHLLQADDGGYYVVKFRENPQHHRIPINELLAAGILNELGLPAPGAALVHVSKHFLDNTPDVFIQLRHSRLLIGPGLHFASRFAGEPDTGAVYDLLPNCMLASVVNMAAFCGMLVFDKWLANADARQCIFVQVRPLQGKWSCAGSHYSAETGLCARMIDNGHIMNGGAWEFLDAPLCGLYCQPLVYRDVRDWSAFEPWLSHVVRFPEPVVSAVVANIPLAWREHDDEALQRAVEYLLRRRKRVPDLLRTCVRSAKQFFPSWRPAVSC